MTNTPHTSLFSVLLRYDGRIRLTKEEEKWVGYGLIIVFLILITWALIALIRYYFREQMIRRKMRWSYSQDPFWNYDEIIRTTKELYIRAQILLNTTQRFQNRLSPYAKARLRLFRKKIVSERDIQIQAAYIVCFDDKKNDAEDSVAVYMKVKVKGAGQFEEILILHRDANEWKITDYVKNPTIYMISHARSIVEKS